MKKFIWCLLAILVVIVLAFGLPKSKVNEYDYLRIHIRANSNSDVDQTIKYQIKDKMVEYLTPKLCSVKTKQQAIDIINAEKQSLVAIGKAELVRVGLYYSVNVKISNEYFPTRTYSNTTLQSGYYDAVIVELGDAVGDNWWCVMYPPLCFVSNGQSNLKFSSRIKNWFDNIFH